MPLNDDVGAYDITVRVKDLGGLSDDQQFTLMVNNINDAPLMNIISDQSIDEDRHLAINWALMISIVKLWKRSPIQLLISPIG